MAANLNLRLGPPQRPVLWVFFGESPHPTVCFGIIPQLGFPPRRLLFGDNIPNDHTSSVFNQVDKSRGDVSALSIHEQIRIMAPDIPHMYLPFSRTSSKSISGTMAGPSLAIKSASVLRVSKSCLLDSITFCRCSGFMIDFFISAKRGSRSGHLLERLVSGVFYNKQLCPGDNSRPRFGELDLAHLTVDVLAKSSVRLRCLSIFQLLSQQQFCTTSTGLFSHIYILQFRHRGSNYTLSCISSSLVLSNVTRRR